MAEHKWSLLKNRHVAERRNKAYLFKQFCSYSKAALLNTQGLCSPQGGHGPEPLTFTETIWLVLHTRSPKPATEGGQPGVLSDLRIRRGGTRSHALTPPVREDRAPLVLAQPCAGLGPGCCALPQGLDPRQFGVNYEHNRSARRCARWRFRGCIGASSEGYWL